jgi:pyridoxal phosphate enzyme (YggS family)
MTKIEFQARLREVRARMGEAAQRSGRDSAEIQLVAISKGQPLEAVRIALESGHTCFGENRVQEARDKIQALGAGCSWHLVGHLQSNKARSAAQLFDTVHSVDSGGLVARLEQACSELGRRLEVFVQVDLADELTKFGVPPAELPDVLQALGNAPHLIPVGLMVLPPFFENAEQVRPYFRRLRELLEQQRRSYPALQPMNGLSMGMSHDFEVAVEEGATHVRIGTALFGARGA